MHRAWRGTPRARTHLPARGRTHLPARQVKTTSCRHLNGGIKCAVPPPPECACQSSPHPPGCCCPCDEDEDDEDDEDDKDENDKDDADEEEKCGETPCVKTVKPDADAKEVAVLTAKRILTERQMDLLRHFPTWSMNSALADAAKGHGQNGEWRPNRGPPYVQATTMFAGQGVDKKGSGNLVRRIVGIKTSFRFHKWEGNNFISNLDGPQFRFLYRNLHSQLIVPPLTMGDGGSGPALALALALLISVLAICHA